MQDLQPSTFNFHHKQYRINPSAFMGWKELLISCITWLTGTVSTTTTHLISWYLTPIPAPDNPSTLRRTAASRHLPGLANPNAWQNPPSYPSSSSPPSLRVQIPLAPIQRFLLVQTPSTNIFDTVEEWLAKVPDRQFEMFMFPEKYTPVPATPKNSPPRSLRGSKLGSWTITPRKLAFFTGALVSLVLFNTVLSTFHHQTVRTSSPPATHPLAISSPA